MSIRGIRIGFIVVFAISSLTGNKGKQLNDFLNERLQDWGKTTGVNVEGWTMQLKIMNDTPVLKVCRTDVRCLVKLHPANLDENMRELVQQLNRDEKRECGWLCSFGMAFVGVGLLFAGLNNRDYFHHRIEF